MTTIREAKRVEGTPPFQFFNPEIAAGDFWILDLESDDPLTQQYIPMDMAEIINDSNYNINVFINQNPKFIKFVAAGTIKKIKNVKFTTLKVLNLDSSNAIPANKIVIEPMIEGMTADEQARRTAKNPLRSLLPFISLLR